MFVLASLPWPHTSTLSALAALLLGVVASRLLLTTISRRRFSAQHHCGAPRSRYPHRDPFGVDFVRAQVKALREKRLLDQIHDNHVRLGTTFTARAFTQPFVATTDPENIKTVLATRFKDYAIGSVRAPRLSALLGKGIFVTDGEAWSHSRAMLRPNFAKDQVTDLEMVNRHIEHLISAVPVGATVDLQDLFARFTLDSSTEFLFGHSTGSQLGGEFASSEFSDNLSFAFQEIALELRMGALSHFRSFADKRRRDKAYQSCRSYVAGFVDKALAMRNSPDQKDASRSYFLKELAYSTQDPEGITDALLNLLFAGRDTTASLLSSLFLVLARRPDMWEKLCDEVSCLNGRPPTYDELRGLKYAKNCLQETLRLWPPVPTNVRIAIRDTVLPRGGGTLGTEPILVPKGYAIQYNVYSMHRRPDLFGPDPGEFRPERWEQSPPRPWEFLPFNGGPRICLGQQYALTEATLVLARFAQVYSSIELRDSRPWTESLTLTACHSHGVHVALQARDKSRGAPLVGA
ncbi:cytochrome P450 alkane hydroxylase-like protein [Nemania sp. FL0916]|nr:cytochrome P450 alkane hydroxylase-like protein [Nemania sp. FL0916]